MNIRTYAVSLFLVCLCARGESVGQSLRNSDMAAQTFKEKVEETFVPGWPRADAERALTLWNVPHTFIPRSEFRKYSFATQIIAPPKEARAALVGRSGVLEQNGIYETSVALVIFLSEDETILKIGTQTLVAGP